jgi:imidazolonepropionase-like amidohydrolase
MRLDPVSDSLYVLGSLWAGLTGSQVCPSSPPDLPRAAYAVVGAPRPAASAGVTAFVDVNVAPMDTERVLPNHTVLVESGRITTLGPSNKIRVPAGAVRIDGRGKYLMPGLANMHEHNGSTEYNNDRWFQFLANGVTTLSHPSSRPSGIKRRVLMDKETARTPSPYPNIYGPARDLDLATAHQLGLPISFHRNQGASFGKMLALGARASTEHLTEYFDTLRVYFGSAGPQGTVDVPEAEIRALVAAAQRVGIWATPTMDCLEERRSPKQVNVARQIIKALQEASGRLLLGADADFSRPASTVHRELAALVRAGLTPYQALLTGTRNAAEYLGILDSAGTVAVGRRADLVLLHGNPLQDVRHTREPVGVMIGGQWLDRTTLDQRLLAPPTAHTRPWVVLQLAGGTSPRPTQEQRAKLQSHYEKFEVLTDSLERAKSPGQVEKRAVERLVRLLAAELGVMRALLTPEQHVTFDPVARVWSREQARQGYPVVIPGVMPTP